MDSRYLESVINRDGQHRVLGRTLHPYCLFDVLILTAEGNPFVTGGGEPDWGHLVVAVLVCSTPARTFLCPRSGWLRWLLVIFLTWRFKRHFQREASKFLAYVEDYLQPPRYWSHDGPPSRAPWTLATAAFIENNSNMTEDEIMRAPIGKMLWKAAALSEQHGSEAELVTEDEYAAMKELGIKP